jgi:hypothetical protein
VNVAAVCCADIVPAVARNDSGVLLSVTLGSLTETVSPTVTGVALRWWMVMLSVLPPSSA